MFNLPTLDDWATEAPSMFDTLCAERAPRWDDEELSWALLTAPIDEVVDTADPAPWLLLESDREGRYPSVPLRELWAELCSSSLTAWSRRDAAKLRELLAAHGAGGYHRASELAVELPAGETVAEAIEAATAASALITAAADPVTLGPIVEAPDAAAQRNAEAVTPNGPDGDVDPPASSAWTRFWDRPWMRRAGFGLGVAACAALLGTGLWLYWLSWIHG